MITAREDLIQYHCDHTLTPGDWGREGPEREKLITAREDLIQYHCDHTLTPGDWGREGPEREKLITAREDLIQYHCDHTLTPGGGREGPERGSYTKGNFQTQRKDTSRLHCIIVQCMGKPYYLNTPVKCWTEIQWHISIPDNNGTEGKVRCPQFRG